MKELDVFKNYEVLQDKDEIFSYRLKLEQAKKELTEIIESLDAHLIRTMKNQNIESFIVKLGDNENKVFYANEKKEKINSPDTLKNMFFSGNDTERDLAKRCLSFSASAWKTAKVKELCDTLGLNQKDFIDTEYTDKIKVTVIPMNILNQKKKGVLS
ncbi:MAG: hypothetical protein WC716_16560 [Chitinophagaceae bacterium]|jgi:hypothetical protein